MKSLRHNLISSVLMTVAIVAVNALAQSPQPYPKAVTDRLIHLETPMLPPPTNVVFRDPDFGSRMVRATDETTNFMLPGTFLRTEDSGQSNAWSVDTRKFYFLGEGGHLMVLDFDPSAMAITGPPKLLPLWSGTFSFIDPDLMYGTTAETPLTITSYAFSTGISTPVIDTRTCGTNPPLGSGRSVVSDDDVTLSLNDGRISISEGGSQQGAHMFVIVYDKKLGCRWYNTQTGEVGGQWGSSGNASTSDRYLIRHAYLSRDGRYVRILVNWVGFYVWDLATLNVTPCKKYGADMQCAGYGVVGYRSYVNSPAVVDDMQVAKRPLNDLAQITQLVYPLPPPNNWGQEKHFTWSNVDIKDSVPACGSTYSYDGDSYIDQPFAGEIFCLETDGISSTVWRFAHNRATYITPYFNTQPLGNISRNGRFVLFTSDWDAQLGTESNGTPRSDVWIVKLE